MSLEVRACPACGLAVSPEARFCSRCGHALADDRGSRRLFGVLVPGPTLVLACLLVLGATLALIAGSPVAAIVLAAFAAASFVLLYGAVERDPENPVARALLTAGRRVRSWTVFGRESLVAWTRASRDVARLRRESQSLRAERKRAVLTFGEAVYREDAAVVEATRARLREIDEGLESRERVRAAALANARHHVQEERVAVQPTRTFSVDELTSGGDPQK